MSTHLLRASVLLATTAACTVATAPVGPRPYAGGPAPAPVSSQPAPVAPPAAPSVACVDPDARDLPDDLDHPTELRPDSTTVGCLVDGDKDLFLVTVPPSAAGSVIAYTLVGSDGLPPVVEVLDGNRKRLVNQYLQRGEEGRGWVAVAGGTSAYLRIAEHGLRGGGTYTLRLAAMPIIDATEPASSAETAIAVALGTPVEGVMTPVANQRDEESEDWFVVDVPSPGRLSIDLDMSQGVHPRLHLLDGNRRQLGSEYGDPGERIVLEREVKSAGRYYVRVSSNASQKVAGTGEIPVGLTRPYVLRVTR